MSESDEHPRMTDHDGQAVKTTPVGIISATEAWSEWLLEDGTVLQGRMVMKSVRRLEGVYDKNGNPGYDSDVMPVVFVVRRPEGRS